MKFEPESIRKAFVGVGAVAFVAFTAALSAGQALAAPHQASFQSSKADEMDQDVQAELYNDIAVAVVEQIGTVETKILVYLENGEDGLDYSIDYLDDDQVHRCSIPAGPAVTLALHKLMSYLRDLPANKRWTRMEYWLDHGEVRIDFSYAEIDPDVPFMDRTPGIREKYFPGAPLKSD